MPPVGVHLTPGSVRAISNGHDAVVTHKTDMSPQQVVGNAIHATLAWLYRNPPESRTVAGAQEALGFYFELEARCCPWVGRDQVQAWRIEARRMLVVYLTTERLSLEPVAVECHLRCVLPSGATLSGRADRIDECEDGIAIVDYKTGRCGVAEGKLGEVISAQVYAVCAEQMFNLPVRRVAFEYLRSDTVRVWEPGVDEVQRLTNGFDALAVSQAPQIAV